MVDARLPEPERLPHHRPAAGRICCARGEVAEEILVDDDGTVLRNTGADAASARPTARCVDAAGRVHPRRFADRPAHQRASVAGAFTRPGTNAQSLRYNDAVARAVLRSLPAAARASSAA